MTYNGSGRRLQAEETRRKIYQCAEKLYVEHDPDSVSVDMIVKAAGVSKGSFYLHYTSKDALIMSMVDDKVAKADAEFNCWVDSLPDDMPSAEALLSLVGKIADVLIHIVSPEAMKSFYKTQIMEDGNVSMAAKYKRDVYGMFYRVLVRGIKRGEICSDFTPNMLSRHMMLALRGVTYDWCVRHPDFDYKAQVLAHFSLLINGLRAQPQ